MIGAISLIYSAFSISLSERTKQMGLLKSIGATRKQIRHSVIFEACVLCAAGIPLGLIAGLGGIGITLHVISGWMGKLWSAGETVDLHLVVTWQSILIAVIVSFITVLISAMIPASKAVRIPAIQAIRQSFALMKKNFFRYILLLLSFLGLELLASCSCAVGFLWVMPYMQITLAAFYQERKDALYPASEPVGYDRDSFGSGTDL